MRACVSVFASSEWRVYVAFLFDRLCKISRGLFPIFQEGGVLEYSIFLHFLPVVHKIFHDCDTTIIIARVVFDPFDEQITTWIFLFLTNMFLIDYF